MAPIMSMVGGILSTELQTISNNRIAAAQEKKARDFAMKANQVIGKKVENDPAYIMKEYLARSGMPGLQTDVNDIDTNLANQVAIAQNSASSGGGMLAILAALQGGANKQKNALYTQSANFETAQKSALADTRYAWQTQFDQIAKTEREKLNRVSSQYQSAADANRADAERMDAQLVGNLFNNAGSMMGGMGEGGGTGTTAAGGINGMTSGGNMSAQAKFNLDNPYTFNMGSGMGF